MQTVAEQETYSSEVKVKGARKSKCHMISMKPEHCVLKQMSTGGQA